MKIQTVAIEKLNPAKYNPRLDLKPGDTDYEKLKKSIDEFDMVEPIIWNKRTGNLVGGHQRLKILKARGDKEVEVSIVDLDDTKEKALNLALNKISGDWDLPKLKDILEELDTGLLDIETTGFDEKEIESLMTQLHTEAEEDDFDADAEAEKIVECKTKLGQVFKLGNHKLMCGDSTKIEDVKKLMGEDLADLVFTDPPYNVNYGSSKNPRHKIPNLVNDNLSIEGWKEFCNCLYENLRLFSNGDIYLWAGSGPEGMRMFLGLVDAGCHWSAIIIWKKQQLILSPAKYQRMYEPCFYGWFGKSSFRADRKQTEVWEINRPLNSKLHPTMKPIELCARALNNSSKQNDIVLDLFGGSGSTLIAAEQLNRKCYMMELDAKYCDVIIERYRQFKELPDDWKPEVV